MHVAENFQIKNKCPSQEIHVESNKRFCLELGNKDVLKHRYYEQKLDYIQKENCILARLRGGLWKHNFLGFKTWLLHLHTVEFGASHLTSTSVCSSVKWGDYENEISYYR